MPNKETSHKTNQEKQQIYERVKMAIPRPKLVDKIPPQLRAPWLNDPAFQGTFMKRIDPFLTRLAQIIHSADSNHTYIGVHHSLKPQISSAPILEREIRRILELPANIASLMINKVTITDRVIFGHQLDLDNPGIERKVKNRDGATKKHHYTTWGAFATIEQQEQFVNKAIGSILDAVKKCDERTSADLAQTFTRQLSKDNGVRPGINNEFESFELVVKGHVDILELDKSQQLKDLKLWILEQISAGDTDRLLHEFGLKNVSQIQQFLHTLAERKSAFFGLDFITDKDGVRTLAPVEHINLVMKLNPVDSRSEHTSARLFSGYPMNRLEKDHPEMIAMHDMSAQRLAKIMHDTTDELEIA